MFISTILRILSPYLIEHKLQANTIDAANGITIYTAPMSLHENSIYIGSEEEILQLFSCQLVEMSCIFICSRTGVQTDQKLPPFSGNLILVDLDIFHLHNLLQRALSSFCRFQLKLTQALYQKWSLQEIVRLGSQELKESIFLCNPGYRLICSCVDLDTYPNDIHTSKLLNQGALSPEHIEMFGSMQNSSLGFHAHIKKIRYNTYTIGRLLFLSRSISSIPIYPELCELLSQAIEAALKVDQSFQYKVDEGLTSLIHDMIEKNIVSRDEISVRMDQIGLKLGFYFCVLVSFEHKGHTIPYSYIISQLLEIFPGGQITTYQKQIVILAAQVKNSLAPDYDHHAFSLFLTKNKAHAGFSHRTMNFYALPISYAQAEAALRMGTVLSDKRDDCIFFYQDFSLYHFIDLCSQDVHNDYHHGMVVHMCHPAITALYRYDVQNNSDLVNLLYEYLSNNCNSLKTAQKLYMHRNTLLNKIAKIKEITHQNLEDGLMQNTLLFSCIVLRYILAYRKEDPFSYNLYLKKQPDGSKDIHNTNTTS